MEIPDNVAFSTIEQSILDLYNKNNKTTSQEIADALQLSYYSVRLNIFRLKRKGVVFSSGNKKINTKSKKTQKSSKQDLIAHFISCHKDLFEGWPSYKAIDTPQIEHAVRILGYNSNDVGLLMRLYVKDLNYDSAINFLYEYESNSELSDKKLQRIKALKHDLRIKLLQQLTGDVPSYFLGNEKE